MTAKEAVNWITNIMADIGKSEHSDLWHYEQALTEIREMLEFDAQQWIPCSETVDIPEHEVICCDKYGEELIGWLSCEDGQWLCESETEMMYDPVAWMEKPKPWRGES